MAKYTIEMDDRFSQTLDELQKSTDATTRADVIRRAVASYKALKDAAPKGSDKNISITTGDKILKDIVLP